MLIIISILVLALIISISINWKQSSTYRDVRQYEFQVARALDLPGATLRNRVLETIKSLRESKNYLSIDNDVLEKEGKEMTDKVVELEKRNSNAREVIKKQDEAISEVAKIKCSHRAAIEAAIEILREEINEQ